MANFDKPRRGTKLLALVATFALAALSTGTTSAEPQDRETFRALAQSLAAGMSGQTNIIIQITRWTTEEESEHLNRVLREQDTAALADELRAQSETGRIRVPGQTGTAWALRYAEQYVEDGKRHIVLATDRPIDFAEAVQQQRRTWNYQVSLIELVLDEDDRGEGTMQVGVALSVDEETGTLDVKDMTTQPIRLVQVRK